MSDLILRPLSLPQAEELYNSRMKEDFPPAELKPFSDIRAMTEAGSYECLGAFRDGEAVGYAYMMTLPGEPMLLLDYLGVRDELRGQGIGGEILSLLPGYYAGRAEQILIESEFPAEASDPAIARRRLGFYTRSGARRTEAVNRIFGVRYVLFTLGCGVPPAGDEAVQAAVERIYRSIFSPQIFAEYARFGLEAVNAPPIKVDWR